MTVSMKYAASVDYSVFNTSKAEIYANPEFNVFHENDWRKQDFFVSKANYPGLAFSYTIIAFAVNVRCFGAAFFIL